MAQNEIVDIRHFAGASGMNLDVDERYLQPIETREIHNARLISSDNNNIGSLENVLGNTRKAFYLPTGVNKEVGSCRDLENNKIYYLLWNESSYHSILRYDIVSKSIEKVLSYEPLLGFSRYRRITSANIIGGLLFWTDGDYPKMIDIEKAYNMTNGLGTSPLDSYTDLTEQILHVIKYPPVSPPSVVYQDDPEYKQNNLRNKLFQFKYRYIYDNGEYSVFSGVSQLALPKNEALLSGEFFEEQYINNRLGVTFNTGSEEVHKIEIAARIGNTGHWRLVKTFYKYDQEGNLKNDSRGSGNPLTSGADCVYWFYNNVIGTVLDQEDAARDYDRVPRKVATQDIIEKNRLIYADITEGFDKVDIDIDLYHQTQQVDLGLSDELQVDNNVIYGDAIYQRLHIPGVIADSVYRLKVGFEEGTQQPGKLRYFYYKTNSETDVDDIRNYMIEKLNAYAGVAVAFVDPVGSSGDWFYILFREGDPGELYLDVVSWDVLNLQVYSHFKGGAWHEFGLQYMDEQYRRGDVNISEKSLIYIPEPTIEKGYTHPGTRNLIQWYIHHDPPSWAKYYQWVYAKNTSMQFFNSYVFTDAEINESGVYTTIDINTLLENTIAANPLCKRPLYNDWQPGDKIRFVCYKDTTTGGAFLTYESLLEYEIIKAELDEENEKYVIYLSNFDIETLSGEEEFIIVAEVYRPRKELPDEENDRVFYEFGPVYEINQYGNHSIASSVFTYGDCYLRLSWDTYLSGIITDTQGFPCENMAFSDYYDSEVISIGRPNVVDVNAKEQRFKADLRYSGTFIQNSQINELCRFLANDFEELIEKYGAITMIREVGYTLKVLQEYRSSSIFIGREGLQQARYEGMNVVVGISEVLGNWSLSEERWGCQNPESVFTEGKVIYFADVRSGAILRWATNGIFPISTYGIRDYIRDTFESFDSLNWSPMVIGYYDAKYDEVCFTMYEDKETPEHIGSIVFVENPANKWISFRSYHDGNGISPTGFQSLGQELVSWLNGELYIHNANTLHSNFYGAQHHMSVEVVSNMNPIITKTFRNIGYSANKKLTMADRKVCQVTIMPTENYPVGMYSELMQDDFVEYEDEYWADFMNDMYTGADINSPTPILNSLFNGRELKGKSVKVKIMTDLTSEVVLFSVIIKSTQSS